MRLPFLVALAVTLLAAPLVAQDQLFPEKPDETWTILQILDAVDAAQIVVLSNPELITESDLENLFQLVAVAEVTGAEDLAARTRTLIALAALPKDEPVPDLPTVDGGLGQLPGDPLARDTDAFRRWVNVGATLGASALGMSAVFYVLAERNYQDWLIETDPAVADQLFRAWQGYDYMGLTLGTATLLTVGVGMPLAFALTPPAATLATPPESTTFTRDGKTAELERLYTERVVIVDEINKLNERERRRSLIRTISIGTGVAGTLGAGTFFYLGDETYTRYLAATESTDAERLSKRVSLFDGLAVILGGLGGAGFGTAATMAVIAPNRTQLERQLERVNASIIRVRASRTIDAPDIAPALIDTPEAPDEGGGR